MDSLSNVCNRMVGMVVLGLDWAVFETVFWLNRQYMSLEKAVRTVAAVVDEYPVAKCVLKSACGILGLAVTFARYLGTSLFYTCVEHDVPYVAVYTLSNTRTGYRLKESADMFTIVEEYPDMDILADTPDRGESDEEEESKSDEDSETDTDDEDSESWNHSLHEAGVRAKITIEECLDVCESLVVARDPENRYLVKTYPREEPASVLAWHANEPSQVTFLTMEYTHPGMKSSVTITIPRAYLYVGNEILSAAFLMRYLGYLSIFTDTVFDASYVVHLIDDEINQIELRWGQYVVLGKHDYRVVDRANLSAQMDSVSVCEQLHRVQLEVTEKEHLD